ncbi:hypothetical protein [Wuhan heteroptera virus 2]|uniref:hypothetical protein n=1 Tax=Wuhan heteroptera virus 2 TaxID=1923702 RepID=UPI000909ED99|nr:hypothetical protein [Wuhan heteroptera virus 2]APG75632.1 hypothetical protein [Wuhan heteroptera virus 2]APG75857.1 hypothetical protein 1 [Wuhan heteroptera virus 2]APG75934.1 hypothetical protein 1 [Wuhan heteroptera virus 2]
MESLSQAVSSIVHALEEIETAEFIAEQYYNPGHNFTDQLISPGFNTAKLLFNTLQSSLDSAKRSSVLILRHRAIMEHLQHLPYAMVLPLMGALTVIFFLIAFVWTRRREAKLVRLAATPQCYREDSKWLTLQPPQAQFAVYRMGKEGRQLLGSGVRLLDTTRSDANIALGKQNRPPRQLLVVPEHVLMSAYNSQDGLSRVMLVPMAKYDTETAKYNEGISAAKLIWRRVATDILVAEKPNNKLCRGAPLRVTPVSPDAISLCTSAFDHQGGSMGKLKTSGFGTLLYSGSTRAGFSGSPYLQNNKCAGIHLGGNPNSGIAATYIMAKVAHFEFNSLPQACIQPSDNPYQEPLSYLPDEEIPQKESNLNSGDSDMEFLRRVLRSAGKDEYQIEGSGNFDYVTIGYRGQYRTVTTDEYNALLDEADSYWQTKRHHECCWRAPSTAPSTCPPSTTYEATESLLRNPSSTAMVDSGQRAKGLQTVMEDVVLPDQCGFICAKHGRTSVWVKDVGHSSANSVLSQSTIRSRRKRRRAQPAKLESAPLEQPSLNYVRPDQSQQKWSGQSKIMGGHTTLAVQSANQDHSIVASRTPTMSYPIAVAKPLQTASQSTQTLLPQPSEEQFPQPKKSTLILDSKSSKGTLYDSQIQELIMRQWTLTSELAELLKSVNQIQSQVSVISGIIRQSETPSAMNAASTPTPTILPSSSTSLERRLDSSIPEANTATDQTMPKSSSNSKRRNNRRSKNNAIGSSGA